MKTFAKSVSRSVRDFAPFRGEVAAKFARLSNRPESEKWAMAHRELAELVSDLFEEEALLIGGIVALHPVRDEVVRKLMSGLDRIRSRYLERVLVSDRARGSRRNSRTGGAPHPAIEEFLRNVRAARAECTVSAGTR